VLSDILLAVDRGDLAALILLDLTVAFDAVDHDILLQRLQVSVAINDVALQWFQPFLPGRSQYIRRGNVKSTVVAPMYGVPQGYRKTYHRRRTDHITDVLICIHWLRVPKRV